MSLGENMVTGQPVQKPQRSNRLYPSLTSTQRQEDVMIDTENIHATAAHHHESLQECTQSQTSSASTDSPMKAQIRILEEQRRELLSINEKWAKEYQTMVQYYKDKVQHLKLLLQHEHTDSEDELCNRESSRTSCPKIQFKTNKECARGETNDITSELLKAEKEANELRVQNSTLTRRGQHQHEEIRRLNKALQEALHSTRPLEEANETQAQIWKQQAEVYKEDFLKERKDREKLKEKQLELEKRFRKVRNELHILKSQLTLTRRTQPEFECSCTNQATNQDVCTSSRV